MLVIGIVLALIQGADALRVTDAPTNTSALLGENATLTCTVTNRQSSENVRWKLAGSNNALTLNEVPVNSDGHYLVSGAFSLVIVNVTLEDQDTYTCDAAGTLYDAHLTVVDLPTNVSVSWETGGEGRGGTGGANNLTCLATRAHPPPSLTWYRNGVALASARAVYSTTADQSGYGEAASVLALGAGREDEEGAVYQCRASYPHLPHSLTANITLTFNGSARTAVGSLVPILAPLLLQWLMG